jgi:hypothetical protein
LGLADSECRRIRSSYGSDSYHCSRRHRSCSSPNRARNFTWARFYPERWLADLTMGLLGNKIAFWLVLAVVTAVIWLALELLARRLIHHRGQKETSPKFIPLLEAARLVFDQTKDSTCAQMARAEGSNDLALRWYCNTLIGVRGDGVTRLMELTGTRPPSRVQEPIKYDRPPPDLEIQGDAAVLTDRYSKQVVVDNLMVPSASVPFAVSFILGLDGAVRGVPPNNVVNAS